MYRIEGCVHICILYMRDRYMSFYNFKYDKVVFVNQVYTRLCIDFVRKVVYNVIKDKELLNRVKKWSDIMESIKIKYRGEYQGFTLQ